MSRPNYYYTYLCDIIRQEWNSICRISYGSSPSKVMMYSVRAISLYDKMNENKYD
jgi:hypothetical protein